MNKFLLFFICVMFCACGSTYDFVREKPSKQVPTQAKRTTQRHDLQRIKTLPVSTTIAYQDPEVKVKASSIIPKLNEAIKKNNETYGQGFKSISKSFKDYKQIIKDSPHQKNGNSTVATSIFKLVGYLILIGLLIIVIALLFFIANIRS